MLRAWARVVAVRPWFLIICAGLFVAIAVVGGGGVSDRLLSGGTADAHAESSLGGDLLDAHFPGARPNLLLLVEADQDVDSPAVAARAQRLTDQLSKEPELAGIGSYWRMPAPALVSRDHRAALVTARITGDESAVDKTVTRIAETYEGERDGLTVRVGGSSAVAHDIQSTIKEDLGRAELIALPITLLVLILAFRGLIAALLPLAVGAVAIVGTNAVLRIITEFTDVSIFAQNLTTALGLGLAIDYALFVVRRFREELGAGSTPKDALVATLGTAGRTVLFSALTVAVSLSAMLLFPLYFLRSFAYAGVSVVALAAAAALVVLPALLMLLGHRVNAFDLTRLFGGRRSESAGVPAVDAGGGWAATARVVIRRAPIFAVVAAAVLVVLGLPFQRVQFGTADYRQLPTTSAARQVQESIAADFTAGATGTIDVAISGAPRSSAIATYARRLAALDGVSQVNSPAGTFSNGAAEVPATPADAARSTDGVSLLSVVPAKGIEEISTQSEDLVKAIRAVERPDGAERFVVGRAATLVDTQHAIAGRLLPAGLIILIVTMILVFLLTGSVVVPLQSILLNALSLSATFGAVVWVFQDGNLSDLLGFTATGYVETSLPVLMFCVAFGLSMDYGVFLLSRIKEEYDQRGDHRQAIVLGLRRTGGVITAAALILAVVLFAIGTSRIMNTKMLGLGVALAVLVDAMVVRCVLAPAVMALTGRFTWWAPGPLRRLHDRVGMSEGGAEVPVVAADQPGPQDESAQVPA